MPVFDDADAFFITWTTYGTWLPGDHRGHASNIVGDDNRYHRKSTQFGTEHSAGDPKTLQRARSQQKWETVWLTTALAKTCADALLEASNKRSWRILRSAIMRNHLHVVLTGSTLNGPSTSRILKGVSQARLSDAVGQSRHWWTRRGSERSISGAHAIQSAMKYVENQDGILIRIAHNQVVTEWPPIIDP